MYDVFLIEKKLLKSLFTFSMQNIEIQKERKKKNTYSNIFWFKMYEVR
jgi:hypothetical protein